MMACNDNEITYKRVKNSCGSHSHQGANISDIRCWRKCFRLSLFCHKESHFTFISCLSMPTRSCQLLNQHYDLVLLSCYRLYYPFGNKRYHDYWVVVLLLQYTYTNIFSPSKYNMKPGLLLNINLLGGNSVLTIFSWCMKTLSPTLNSKSLAPTLRTSLALLLTIFPKHGLHQIFT